jgi:hypothetical protein
MLRLRVTNGRAPFGSILSKIFIKLFDGILIVKEFVYFTEIITLGIMPLKLFYIVRLYVLNYFVVYDNIFL